MSRTHSTVCRRCGWTAQSKQGPPVWIHSENGQGQVLCQNCYGRAHRALGIPRGEATVEQLSAWARREHAEAT